MMEFDLQGPLPGHLSKKTYLATQTTLVYLIAEHARLTLFLLRGAKSGPDDQI